MSVVLGLFLGYKDPGRRLARRPAAELVLKAGKGIVGDKTFGRTRTRQVNILQARFYDWFDECFRRRLPYGSAGENVVVGNEVDLNWAALHARFRLGSAVLELRDFRTPCKTLSAALIPEHNHPDYFVGRVGILCEVVADGSVGVGDGFEPV